MVVEQLHDVLNKTKKDENVDEENKEKKNQSISNYF